MTIFLMVLGFVLFVSLVVVHEFGHFIMARRNGVDVEEFGIGFPPMAWGKKLKSGLLFTVNWLPLGGFVKLKGEHDADTAKGSYGAASLWAKTKIIGAGVAMNLFVAILMFMLLALIGMPKIIDNQFTVASDTKVIKNEVLVGAAEDGSPAANGGLIQRDQIVSITGENAQMYKITSSEVLRQTTSELAGQKVTITYIREGQTKTTDVTVRSKAEVEASKKTNQPKGYLGVDPTEFTLQRSTWSAPVVGVGVTAQFTGVTFKGLGSIVGGLFKGNVSQATSQVSGPVGIVVLIKDGSKLGIQFILMIIAVLSLTLAIMNVLPIPALDGGRLFLTYLYRIMGKKLTPKTEDLVNGVGFVVLMVLILSITVVDFKRFF